MSPSFFFRHRSFLQLDASRRVPEVHEKIRNFLNSGGGEGREKASNFFLSLLFSVPFPSKDDIFQMDVRNSDDFSENAVDGVAEAPQKYCFSCGATEAFEEHCGNLAFVHFGLCVLVYGKPLESERKPFLQLFLSLLFAAPKLS